MIPKKCFSLQFDLVASCCHNYANILTQTMHKNILIGSVVAMVMY